MFGDKMIDPPPFPKYLHPILHCKVGLSADGQKQQSCGKHFHLACDTSVHHLRSRPQSSHLTGYY